MRYLLAAGDRASGLFANEDAARYYERALQTLAACAAETIHALAASTRERLGDVLGRAGERARALTHYRAALAGHEGDGVRPTQARLRRKIGALHWEAGDREGALTEYRAGLALLDGQAEDIELAHLYQEMGRFAFRSGDNEGAMDWAQQALAPAERLEAGAVTPAARQDVAAARAHAYNTLGVALWPARAGWKRRWPTSSAPSP